jgi:hypothetical protein
LKRDGVEIGANDVLPEGFPHREPIKDLDGIPLTEPVPFDGLGNPAELDAERVWLIYQTKEERPFTPLAGVLW